MVFLKGAPRLSRGEKTYSKKFKEALLEKEINRALVGCKLVEREP